MPPPKDPVQWARESLDKGNLPFVEIIAREIFRAAPGHPAMLGMLAEVARRVGEHQWAEAFDTQARNGPGSPPVAPAPWTPADTPDPTNRFLLIRAWGYGFWADVDHVLGQLLLAELTGRTPVVHWGPTSLFGSPDHPNAWTAYFQPFSHADPAELAAHGLPVFPSKWSDADPLGPDLRKLEGAESRMAALYYFNRDEPLAVSDFHTGISAIAEWIRPGHRFAGAEHETIYRNLVAESLKLQPAVLSHIDDTAARVLPEGPKVAIHLRGGDKFVEDHQLAATIDQAFAALDQALQATPDAAVFALTDDTTILERLRARLGPRLHTTDATRAAGRRGVHNDPARDGHRLGLEVLTDTYLAARCDAFIGIGSSNVSCMVQYLKQWGPGQCRLIGPSIHRIRNWHIHMR